MPLTERQLNRATLARQLLLGREAIPVVAAMERIVALQAQEPPSPYVALWNRIADFDPASLDRAFAELGVVKGSLMRVTMHAVATSDYPTLHEAMQTTLRAARLGDPRFTVAGLSIAETDALIPQLTQFMSEPRSPDDIEAWLDERLGVRPRPGIWWALRHYGPFVHAPTGGPWSFAKRAHVAAPAAAGRPAGRGEAMQHLVRRYLDGFGPASARDVATFAMVYAGPVRDALRDLVAAGEAVRLTGPNGSELFDVPGGLVPPEDSPAPPRLLGMWDEVLLAYADRSRLIPPEYRRHVTRMNGDVLPTLLVDGYVAGVWRPTDGRLEVTAFRALPDTAWARIEGEARALAAFLAPREADIYRRYQHWWKDLRGAEARVI